jgi:hypothetical protein
VAFADLWSWLDGNRNQIGALSSIIFGLSSAVVAWLAYRINRVNSLGLPPVLLVLRMVGDGKDIANVHGTAIVMWNRRKDPIVVTSVRVQFLKAEVDFDKWSRELSKVIVEDASGTIRANNRRTGSYFKTEFVMEAGTHKRFEVIGTYIRPGATLGSEVLAVVRYFDPGKARHVAVAGRRASTPFD